MELSLLVLCHLFLFAIPNIASEIVTRIMTGQLVANHYISKFAAKVGHPGEDCLDCCY